MSKVNFDDFRKSQKAFGAATVLAIGTATPKNIYYQDSFPEFYLGVTNSEDSTTLKEKFKNFCGKCNIEKRHMILTEDFLKANPNMCSYAKPSLDTRRELLVHEVPKMGIEAASEALKEWNRARSSITHMVYCTTSTMSMPGDDIYIRKVLGLDPCVNRVLLNFQGCSGGGTALRVAKDMAENNRGARVLLICSESCLPFFRGPEESDTGSLIGAALFSDGAGAIIVGSDPIPDIEKPLFELALATQSIIPETDTTIQGHLLEIGLTFHLEKNLPDIISNNMEKSLMKTFAPFGITDWNSLFYVVHPGGPLILTKIENALNLNADKLKDSRKILNDYGNMSSACVIFILDELRKRAKREGSPTTGGGSEWGVLIGIGPGLLLKPLSYEVWQSRRGNAVDFYMFST